MRKLLAIFFLFVLVFSFAACGEKGQQPVANDAALSDGAVLTDDGLVGAWIYTKTHEDVKIETIIVLKEDDKYIKLVSHDDSLISTEQGDYELVDEKVKLYDSEAVDYHGKATLYDYKDGKLAGIGYEFKKI